MIVVFPFLSGQWAVSHNTSAMIVWIRDSPLWQSPSALIVWT